MLFKMSLFIENHSGGKSFIVKGDSREYKDILIANFGRWNPALKGYVYSNKHLETLKDIVQNINNGTIEPSNTVPNYAKTQKTKTKSITAPSDISGIDILSDLTSDNDKVKTFIYELHSPTIEDTVIIELKNNKIVTTVSHINPSGDIVHLVPINDADKTYEMGIYSGNWQLRGVFDQHTITFN